MKITKWLLLVVIFTIATNITISNADFTEEQQRNIDNGDYIVVSRDDPRASDAVGYIDRDGSIRCNNTSRPPTDGSDDDESDPNPEPSYKTCVSERNACGQVNRSRVPVRQECNVAPPPDPTFLGNPCQESYNEQWCGEAISRTKYGTLNCSNTCSNFVYPEPIKTQCTPDDDPEDEVCPAGSPVGAIWPDCNPGVSCTPGVDSECTYGVGDPLKVKIDAKPKLVNFGGKTFIDWTSINATTCSIGTPDNPLLWTSLDGREEYGPIKTTTDFNITCTNAPRFCSTGTSDSSLPSRIPDGRERWHSSAMNDARTNFRNRRCANADVETDSVKVRVLPKWREF